MPSPDREHYFIGRTYDLAGSPEAAFAPCLEAWRGLVESGLFRNLLVLESVGNVDLSVDAKAVRPWNLFMLAELAGGADRAVAVAAEEAAFANAAVKPLSRQLLCRKAGENLAVPRPEGPHARLPDGFRYAVEYIWVPPERHADYSHAMRRLFGPLGIELVKRGAAYRIIITEVVEDLHFDPSLPRFNQIHVLTGDFDDPAGGFIPTGNAIVQELAGAGTTMEAALAELARYRSKPRMSKSKPVPGLCIGPD
jgi:hypothetical protein